MRDVSSFSHYKNLILHKAYADFRSEAERTYLGVAWWVLEPLIDLCIYYLVFAVFLKRGGEDYIPFLICGLVSWRYLNTAVLRGANSIILNVAMVRQIALKKIIFPFVAVMTCSFEFVFSLALLFVMLWLYDYQVTVYCWAFPLILFVELLLIMGLALPLSALVPFMPDLSKFLAYIFRIGFYMSGILYSIYHLPESAKAFLPILTLNPAVPIVYGYRNVLIYEQWPDFQALGIVAGLSVAGIGLGVYLITRFDQDFAKRITR